MKNKFSIALSLAVIVAMLVTSLVLADNVENDVVSTPASITLQAGVSSSFVDVQFYVQQQGAGADGDSGCNFDSSTEKLTFTINTPAGVTANPGSLTFNECHVGSDLNSQTVRFSASASAVSGNISFTENSNNTGGSFNYGNAVFYINVSAPPLPADTTPPVISYVLNPPSPDGGNGWYKSDVTLTWIITDDESDVTIDDGCADQNITADQPATDYSCSASSDGGSAGPVTVSIKRDATAPIVSVTPDRVPDHNSWYNATVTFETNGTDSPSGIASCSDDQTYSGPDGADLAVSGSCTDNAGNVGNGISDTFDFDDTNPTITWHDVQNFYYGFPPATSPSCEANDDTSGPDGCSVSGYDAAAAVGLHELTAIAYDIAGNTANAPNSYTVMGWTPKGFYQPVDMGSSVWNTVKGGSTVPFKFELFAGSTELKLTSYVQGFTAQAVSCPTNGYTADAIEVTATGGTSLRFDTTGDQFIYNWQTPRKPGACYMITMTAKDGSTISANFILK